MVVYDSSPMGKDRQIAVLKFRLDRTINSLERVSSKMQYGQIIDVHSLNSQENGQGINLVEMYMRNLAVQYPQLQASLSAMKKRDKLNLFSKIVPFAKPGSN